MWLIKDSQTGRWGLQWRRPPVERNERSGRHTWVVLSLFAACTLLYYFGELADFAGWQELQWGFFYTVHDAHRLLFLAPIIYASYFFRIKGATAVAIAALVVFLPRALFVSPFPDAMFRAMLSAVAAGAVGLVIAALRNRHQALQLRAQAAADPACRPSGRTERSPEHRAVAIGHLELDLFQHVAKRSGQVLKLTPTEFKLLAYLVTNRGRAVTHAELLHNIWGQQYGQETEYLRVFVSQLRRKIEADPSNPSLIVTEPRIGYRLVEPK